jgi:hypothetical protein
MMNNRRRITSSIHDEDDKDGSYHTNYDRKVKLIGLFLGSNLYDPNSPNIQEDIQLIVIFRFVMQMQRLRIKE